MPLKEEGGHPGAKRFTGRVGDALDLGRFPWGMKVGRCCFRMGGRRRGKERRAKRWKSESVVQKLGVLECPVGSVTQPYCQGCGWEPEVPQLQQESTWDHGAPGHAKGHSGFCSRGRPAQVESGRLSEVREGPEPGSEFLLGTEGTLQLGYLE